MRFIISKKEEDTNGSSRLYFGVSRMFINHERSKRWGVEMTLFPFIFGVENVCGIITKNQQNTQQCMAQSIFVTIPYTIDVRYSK